jgi:hypothetical protein
LLALNTRRNLDVTRERFVDVLRLIGGRGRFAVPRRPAGVVRRSAIVALAGALALPCLAATSFAQKGTGAVSGVVKDSAGAAIPSVEVVVIKTGVVVRTDSRGKFLIAGVPVGPTDLSFRRVSFAPVVLGFPIAEGDTIEAQVTLGGVQSLPMTIVDAPAEHQRRLDAFEAHRRAGAGHFITRSDIERRSPHRLTDLLRSIPGTSIGVDANGLPVLHFSGAPHSDSCDPAYYMDGMRVRTLNIDDISPVDIEGIELYSGSAGLPPEFNQFYVGSTSVCGTVVIWTRLPGNNKSGAS